MKDPNQKITKHPDGRVSVETINTDPSMTQQQFADDCDINNIMRKYDQTGQFLTHTKHGGIYADFSQIQDYREMLDTVIYAQEAFASLPANVRKRFDNDPGKLLEFTQDPNNYDEGVKLGLLNRRPIVENQQNQNQTKQTPQTKNTNKQNPNQQTTTQSTDET